MGHSDGPVVGHGHHAWKTIWKFDAGKLFDTFAGDSKQNPQTCREIADEWEGVPLVNREWRKHRFHFSFEPLVNPQPVGWGEFSVVKNDHPFCVETGNQFFKPDAIKFSLFLPDQLCGSLEDFSNGQPVQGCGDPSFFQALKHERDSLHEKFIKDGRRDSGKPNPIQQGVAGVRALEADPREESEPRQVSVGQEAGVIHLRFGRIVRELGPGGDCTGVHA